MPADRNEYDEDDLIAVLAGIAIKHKIDAETLARNAAELASKVNSEILKRTSERNRRLTIPERNRQILKRNLDGTPRRELAHEFELSKETITEILSGGKRDILKNVFELGISADKVAGDYDVSPNQIVEIVRKLLSAERDQLASRLIAGDMGWNRPIEIRKLLDMTQFLNDIGTSFFVYKDSFDELVDYKAIKRIRNSKRPIVWDVEPALVMFSDGSWNVVSIEQAWEIARSIEALGTDGKFDGRVVLSINHISGEAFWERGEIVDER